MIASILIAAMHASEYAHGNQVIVSKIDYLARLFSHMKRTRGDGNCFYRAFAYSYLENLLANMPESLAECDRYIYIIQTWTSQLINASTHTPY